MKKPEVLKNQALKDALHLTAQQKAAVVVTYHDSGKWRTIEAEISGLTDNNVHIDVSADPEKTPTNVRTDQPVGIIASLSIS